VSPQEADVPEVPSKLQIAQRQVGDVMVLDLSGEIMADDGDLKFGRLVDDLVLRQGHKKLLVNLGGVSYIDSAGVGMIVAELKIIRAKGADMRLLNLTARNKRLLATMRLMTVFEVFEDEALALRSFALH
jgi:anti-sigma B factor antagonist